MQSQSPNNLSGILVSAHDAGGANQILHLVKSQRMIADLFLSGPAVEIARSLKLDALVIDEPRDLFKYQKYIYGTNKKVQLSDEIFLHFKVNQTHTHTVAFLENWVNYKERFQGVLPNQIWVSDRHAYTLAIQTFGVRKVRLRKNYYFDYLVNNIKLVPSEPTMLYMASLVPMRAALKEHQDYCICKSFAASVELLQPSRIILRNHPNSNLQTCLAYLQPILRTIRFEIHDWVVPIENSLSSASWVVGAMSYGLYLSKSIGLETFAIQSEHGWRGPKFRLLSSST